MKTKLLTKVIKINSNYWFNSTRQLTQTTLNKLNTEKAKTENAKSEKQQIYKATEAYDAYSYFDIEIEMVKYRIPQPTSLPPKENTWCPEKLDRNKI
ncbi:hypothetical protein BpHYR1_032366 [Brachionus plicatilis]|uniref:Uncharacterized protein n=1 Tax=Brachionus plicatilis TaxID=10195 RepID=A0A3M7SGT1_BRAPC|nr:hypothetical protein BpHYR1_032366 [Brachionus plicatilis]